MMNKYIGNKNNFIRVCTKLNVPVPKTYLFIDFTEFHDFDLNQIDYPVILKRGEDLWHIMYVCKNENDVASNIKKMISIIGEKECFQIQEYIDYNKFNVKYYNATYHINGFIKFRFTTEQVLNLSAIHSNIKVSHLGNMRSFLSESHISKKYCDKIVTFLRDNNYKGELGIDFGVYDDRVFFLEVNARRNRGTYLYYEFECNQVKHDSVFYVYIKKQLFDLISDKGFNTDNKYIEHCEKDGYVLLLTDRISAFKRIEDNIHEITHSDKPTDLFM